MTPTQRTRLEELQGIVDSGDFLTIPEALELEALEEIADEEIE